MNSVFKIDTVRFKLRGNYIDQILNSDIEGKIESYSKVNDSEFYSVGAKLGNLQMKATEYNFYLTGSLSNFMKAPVTHTNISRFFELINDNLNVDIENAKIVRFDVCTDIQTKIGIQNIGPSIELMAEAEGLQAHKNAVTLRLKELKSC